jgi:hypothetical protein
VQELGPGAANPPVMTTTRFLAAVLSAALVLGGGAALAEDAVDPADGTWGEMYDDPEGDANDFLILQDTPLPSSDTLDLTQGRIGFDHDTATVVFELGVKDLSELPPEGATGKTFYVNFSYGGGRYFVTAAEDLVNGQTFRLGTFSEQGLRTSFPGNLPGTFDHDNNVIRIELSSAAFTAAVPSSSGFAPGQEISVSDVLAQRYINLVAAGVTPTADTAVGDWYDIPEPAEEDEEETGDETP